MVGMGMGMRMGMTLPGICRSADHHELRLVDPLQAAEFRGQVLKFVRRAAQRDHLHAEIMRQMHVRGRNHVVAVRVLDLDHPVGESGPVVVVDEREAGGHVRGIVGPGGGGQLFPNQLADRFAAGGELPLLAMAVERRQQVFFQRHRETDDSLHVPSRG